MDFCLWFFWLELHFSLSRLALLWGILYRKLLLNFKLCMALQHPNKLTKVTILQGKTWIAVALIRLSLHFH